MSHLRGLWLLRFVGYATAMNRPFQLLFLLNTAKVAFAPTDQIRR